MNKALVVVDMQNDFIDGALGTPEAQAIIPKVYDKILNWKGDIFVTQDSHTTNYLQTREGRFLPVEHCIVGTVGWRINDKIQDALDKKKGSVYHCPKETFGSILLAQKLKTYDEIEFIGLCTDICVISNVLVTKTFYPEKNIYVDANCCAGVTPEKHEAALEAMRSCQVEVI